MKQEVKAEDTKPSVARGYRDIPLFSSGASDSVTHLMKFGSHTRIDPNNETQFTPPVKLNRKTPLRLKMPPAKPGDQVIDKWGKPVMTTEGKPLLWPSHDVDLEHIRPYLDLDKPQSSDAAADGAGFTRHRLFRKRVREVHKSTSAARRTRNEEFYPWVLEDFDTAQEWESSREPLPNSLRALEAWYLAEQERRAEGREPKPSVIEEPRITSGLAPHAPWVGQLEGESDEHSASHHVLFVFDDRNAGGFKVVPVRRQYKFMPLQKHMLNSEQVEEEFARHQKSAETERWLLRDRYKTGAGLGSSSSTGASRGGDGRRLPMLSLPGQPSLGWQSSAHLVAVRGEPERSQVDDDDLFGPVVKNETTYDELDYEDTFADDDERAEVQDDTEDAEARELEERLKREMVADRLDDGDDVQIKMEPDDAIAVNRRSGADNLLGSAQYGRHDDAMLTGSGRQMRRIMKALSRREGLDTYDSDEEAKNPYASDDDSDDNDDDLDVLHPERAILEAREEKARREREAKEQASTPRAASPEADGGVKRKNDTASRPDAKKARVDSPPRSASPVRSPLEAEIVQLISSGQVATTSDLVQHFRARLKQDLSLKEQLSAAVKRIAYMDKKENKLKLKESAKVSDAAATSPRDSRP